MTGEWYNNEIGKYLYEKYPHDFSVCDIDGVCRCFYKQNGKWKIRLIIYESKHDNETISNTQLDTLYWLDDAIDWTKFDKYSGTFLIQHNENLDELKIHKIINESKYPRPQLKLKYIKTMTMDGFYKWVSAKDIKKQPQRPI